MQDLIILIRPRYEWDSSDVTLLNLKPLNLKMQVIWPLHNQYSTAIQGQNKYNTINTVAHKGREC